MGDIIPLKFTELDRAFLKGLGIRQDEDIVPYSQAGTTNTRYWVPQARDEEGHPVVNVKRYRVAPSDRRLDAVQQRYAAHQAGQRCRCGALHPSACCYL